MLCHKRLLCWLLIVGLAMLALNCGLTEMLQRAPTPTSEPVTLTATETPSATASSQPTDTVAPDTPEPTSTLTPTPEAPVQPSATPTPTETQTPPVATNTSTPSPTPADTATPGPTETPPGLRIESFDVELEDVAGGKIVRCTWDTSGATGVRLVVGTSQRFPPWQEGGPDGMATFELAMTIYDRPGVTLTAFGEGGGEAIETVRLDWTCDHTYFFAGTEVEAPAVCPVGPPTTRQGARQPFQGGSTIWIPDIEGRDVIFVLYSSGSWNIYDDAWDESQPESDPSIIPPSGLFQPIRGFGKVWREHPEVQSGLGWATAGEEAVSVTYQRQMQESLGGVRYVQVAGGALLRLSGLGGSGSTWSTLP